MNIEEKYVKIDFLFQDEYNQESRLVKTFNPTVFEDQDTFDFLVDEFKNFMLSIGFTLELVDKIVILDKSEDEENEDDIIW